MHGGVPERFDFVSRASMVDNPAAFGQRSTKSSNEVSTEVHEMDHVARSQ